MTRRAALLLLVLSGAPAAWAQGSGPAAPVARLDDALVQIMKMGSNTPFAQRAAVLTPVVQQVFDLPRILQVSVGFPYAGFSPEVKAKLLDVFTQYTVASYVANFDSYNGQRFTISPQTRSVAGDVIVTTHIVPTSGDATRIDYQMHRTGAGWQAVDVLVDGSISRVAVQRSDFRSVVSSGGASGLIRTLQRKVASLQSGNS